ncbi:MAG TPA: helix-hairpin-helix domain-containing protein [Paludibacter sp.]|nr:helix-hairpin-helix domain-containing protein [Paludibacter sp.]
MRYLEISILVVFFLLFSHMARAQDAVATTEQLISDIFEEYTAESGDEIDFETFYDDLIGYAQNPVNINLATREELGKLPFLSDSQVESILAYIYRFGTLKSTYELRLIDGLDMTDIRRMLPFVVVAEGVPATKRIYLRDVLGRGRNELFLRADKGAETKEAYRFDPDEEQAGTKAYAGNDVYNSIKYRFHYKDRILVGLTAEKDAGEQFWGTKHKGYDFYSGAVQLNGFGKFKTVVAGDFKANFGQGLVLGTEFGTGKSAYVLNVYPRNSGLKKYSSTDETNFFRGAGATVRFGNLDITAFYSGKQVDGDTVNGSFPSVYKTGLHRTDSEWSKKHTVNQQVAGGNVTWTFSHAQLGFTAVHTRLDNRLEPEKSVYSYFYFSGNTQTTAGINYRARLSKLNLFGETAMAQNGAVATINGMGFSPLSRVSLVALHRYYSPQYDTFFASAFSEASRINNEGGVYLGVEIRPVRNWRLAAYADNYQFRWPKFGVSSPSAGTDYLLQLDFTPKRDIAMYWRFKYEEKGADSPGNLAVMPVVITNRRTSLRYNLVYSFGNFSFKNVLEGNLFREGYAAWSYGVNVLQDISYQFGKLPLKVDFRMQAFDAVDYENRFYTYEKDVMYAFSIPMFYGLGSRYYLNLRYDLDKYLSVWLKAAQTVYADDRESISSGNEKINGNRKTDFRLLLKWEF